MFIKTFIVAREVENEVHLLVNTRTPCEGTERTDISLPTGYQLSSFAKQGDNALGSVRPSDGQSVRPFVCALTAEAGFPAVSENQIP